MANGYADDPVKAKARHEIYKSLQWLPRDLEEGTALYLASDNPLESELLDRDGRFPRERRLILEGDQSKVPAVQRANPSVLVVPMTTHEFFAGEWRKQEYQRFFPLWYCGLDYQEQLTRTVINDLELISDNRLLQDGGIIYTNIVGRREQPGLQEEYLRLTLREVPWQIVGMAIGMSPAKIQDSCLISYSSVSIAL